MSSWDQIQTQSGTAQTASVALPPPMPQGAVPIGPTKEEGQSPKRAGTVDATAAPAVAKVGTEDVGFIAEELNNSMAMLNSSVSFSIDDVTDSTVIKVIDNDTGDVIRQVPPETMLNLLQRMTEMVGLLLDESV